MSATHFNWFDNWKTEVLACPKCGWMGTFHQGAVEYYDELMDCSCPKCDFFSTPMLAIVSYPTMREYEENWDRLDDDTRKSVLQRKEFLRRYSASLLQSPDQLPELESETIILVWDIEEETGTRDQWSVIRCGETLVWRELAGWSGYWRYPVILKLFIEKYGGRLEDLILTSGCEYNLKWDISLVEESEITEEVNRIKKSMMANHDAYQHRSGVSKEQAHGNSVNPDPGF